MRQPSERCRTDALTIRSRGCIIGNGRVFILGRMRMNRRPSNFLLLRRRDGLYCLASTLSSASVLQAFFLKMGMESGKTSSHQLVLHMENGADDPRHGAFHRPLRSDRRCRERYCASRRRDTFGLYMQSGLFSGIPARKMTTMRNSRE